MARLRPAIGPQPPPTAEQEPLWQPLGRLVLAFGQIENQIDWCISALTSADGTDERPSVASQIRNLCSRIALVEALFRQLTADEDRHARMHELMKELRVLIKFRNGALHGPWGAYVAGRRVWQKPRTDPSTLSLRFMEVSVEAIDSHIERVTGLGNALVELVEEVAAEHAMREVPVAL